MRILYTIFGVLVLRFVRCGGNGCGGGVEQRTPPGPTHPETSLTSKVDGSLFNVEESLEDHVKVLKLTPKKGAEATKLTFDGQTVWEDNNKSCPSAVLYMDGEKPTLAVLVTRDKNNKQGTVYRYHDGKQWKDGKEGDHKKKLGELKKCKSEPALSDEEPELQQGCIPPRQRPVWVSVDLSKEPEQEKVDYYNSVTGDVSYKRYSSKFSNNDTDQILLVKKVTDNGNTIWEAGERECMELAQYRSKGGFAILRIHVNVGNDVKHKFFEKKAGKWEEITHKKFEDQLQQMVHKESNKPEPQEPKTR